MAVGGIIDSGARVAIVTGGTRGLGAGVARRLALGGWRVHVCGRSRPDQLPEGVAFSAVDVRDPEAARAFVDSVAQGAGRLDLLVNNAGGSPAARALDSGPRFVDAILRLNLVAPLYMAQAAHPHMVATDGGSIVNIASVSAVRPSPGTAVYGAAKAGLVNLTQSLAQEWGPDGVRVNVIIVGLMATETAQQTYGDDEAQAAVARSLPLRRMGTAEDVAGAVLWLAGEQSGWVSGARINVDGGGERPYFLDLVKGG